MRHPSGERRTRRFQEIGACVEERVARPAAQPLQAAARREIDLERVDVERNDPRRLIRVEDRHGAHFVRARDDCRGVHDERRSEQHVRERDDRGGIVDGVEHAFGPHGQVALRRHDAKLEPGGLLRAIEIDHRRKIHLGADQTAAGRRRPQAGECHHVCARHVLVHAHGPGRRTDHARDFVADLARHFPPAILPSADAAGGPDLRVFGEILCSPARHRAERVADHVDGPRQNRKFVAPAVEIVHRCPLCHRQ